MIAVPTSLGTQTGASGMGCKEEDDRESSHLKSKALKNNVALELLNESDSDLSECEVKSEQQILEEYKRYLALSKNDSDCRTIFELQELKDLREKQEKEIKANQSALTISNALGTAFRKAQKIVDLQDGLNLQHFVKIGTGVLYRNPQRALQDGLMARLKFTASREGKSNLIYDLNKARAKKLRMEERIQMRQHTILRSQDLHVDKRENTDADKVYFINEFLKILAYAENYYKQRKFIALFNTGMVLAFLCIQIQHYALANKVYSMFGQMLLVAKKGPLAVLMYNKLMCCAHTDKDAVSKMFAYKQLGYVYCQMEKYESAIIAFKHMLAIAWTIKSSEGELAAYEGLALMNLYCGQIQKCKFFDARITNGQYEPHDSQLYKITVSSCTNENRWLKESSHSHIGHKQSYIDLAIDKAEDMGR